MGTRSLTRIYRENGDILVTIYRQFDGYPQGHGLDLAEILEGRAIVNGFPPRPRKPMANGMGCLAAQIIARLKEDVGNVYVAPNDTEDAWQDYEYHITGKPGDSEAQMKIVDWDGRTFYSGPASGLLDKLEELKCKNEKH